MYTDNAFDRHMNETRELENFLFSFIGELTKRRLTTGEDVARIADELNLAVPELLKGAPIEWVGKETPSAEDALEDPLVFVRPGVPQAVGLTIGCIRWGRWRACLECGWLYCRIVVKRRF